VALRKISLGAWRSVLSIGSPGLVGAKVQLFPEQTNFSAVFSFGIWYFVCRIPQKDIFTPSERISSVKRGIYPPMV